MKIHECDLNSDCFEVFFIQRVNVRQLTLKVPPKRNILPSTPFEHDMIHMFRDRRLEIMDYNDLKTLALRDVITQCDFLICSVVEHHLDKPTSDITMVQNEIPSENITPRSNSIERKSNHPQHKMQFLVPNNIFGTGIQWHIYHKTLSIPQQPNLIWKLFVSRKTSSHILISTPTKFQAMKKSTNDQM
ncbi:hypothetical protein CEXT_644841 [Caerostris extrusa]|uniref:Uncharacterized protein n=1 Tax=Caerostris extrusa TaxID=172846 RepID=A0AAV4NE63_CAEEX|nr:hypothetical protein CEXT_644841 [Caerostris extrusa]